MKKDFEDELRAGVKRKINNLAGIFHGALTPPPPPRPPSVQNN